MPLKCRIYTVSHRETPAVPWRSWGPLTKLYIESNLSTKKDNTVAHCSEYSWMIDHGFVRVLKLAARLLLRGKKKFNACTWLKIVASMNLPPLGPSHRKLLQRWLNRTQIQAKVLDRPKILGTRLELNRRWSTPVAEEDKRLQSAINVSNMISKLPGLPGMKIGWVKGAVVSVCSTPVLSRLPAVKDLQKVQTAASQAMQSVGHTNRAPLGYAPPRSCGVTYVSSHAYQSGRDRSCAPVSLEG